MSTNKLSHLVGDYQSDSDNDDSQRKNKPSNAVNTNWTQCTDVSSGHPYYWNIVTKEVTWEMPGEYGEFLQRAAHQITHSHKKWVFCYTDDETPYYFNEVTREISWEKPIDFVEVTTSKALGDNNRNDVTKLGDDSLAVRTKLNLVPEYNSDDSDDESSKQLDKPLFPSSIQPSSSQVIKPIEISTDQSTDKPDSMTSHKKSETRGEGPHKEKPSFASIITGGRSPQQETVDINLYISQETEEESSKLENVKPSSRTENDSEMLTQKTFQRKRRIEFNVHSALTKRPNQTNEEEITKEVSENIANLRNRYNNFQKGGTEFSDKADAIRTNDEEDARNVLRDKISTDQKLLQSKLNFLCQGRADVSPVQIIQIQLQALQSAYVAEALQSDYLLEWMENISNDLIKLESDAAPNGWKCLWNRERAQYCYENMTNGDIKWEYPEVELSEQQTQDNTVMTDDAMDICTTPPPNEHEDLSAAYYHSKEYLTADVAPPPPAWPTTESGTQNTEKPLDDELASFYSDIARLEPDTPNEDNSSDKSPSNREQSQSPDNSAETDDKKKKKKKKSKKLEPWRSGNLETWINKWQKAQKELDG